MGYPIISSIRMGMVSGHPPQTRSFRSSGSIRSRSASELLPDGKRPSFLASTTVCSGISRYHARIKFRLFSPYQ